MVHGAVERGGQDERATSAARSVRRSVRITVAAVLLLGLILAVASACQTPRASARVAKGLWDDTFVGVAQDKQDKILNEIASPSQLRASTVRLMVFWARAEPFEDQFNEAYLTQLKTAIKAAQDHGLRVILTTYEVPKWASNQTLWKSPPPDFGFKKGIYYYFYAPRTDADTMLQYRNFAEHIATEFQGEVFAYEAWNEANIFWFLYPQRTAKDGYLGVRTYFSMLKAFSQGIRTGDSNALVLGGNTASQGVNNVRSTSPLKWARWLKSHHVLDYADAYSHHVYALGGSGQPILAPELPPRFPQWTVVLGNIGTLLHIFPKTAFYLTEWGYNAAPSKLFGGGGVGEKNQAAYITRGFKLAGRYPQIKLLIWYLRKDVKGGGSVFSPPMSTGLRRVNGVRRPAWFAFRRVP
jgi:Cellulase (glycosyl hydrolase family 5)